MAITAAQLQVRIGADHSDLDKGLAHSERATSSFADKIGGLGKVAGAAAVAGGAAFAGLGVVAIKTAADFQQSLANVGAATGATGEQMKAMRAEALKIGADTSKGASEAVAAMGELTRSGISVQDVVGGVGRTVVQLSEATGSSVANMATLLSDSMNVFKVTAADSGAAANTLAKAAGASSISIDHMAQSLSAGGLVAKSAGLNIDQFATAIGIMGNQGLKSSDAGTSLKSMIAGLTPVSKAGKQAMDSLGISVFDAEGKFRPFPDILASLSKGFSGLTEEQRAQTAELLFGSDGIRAFNALVPDTSKGLADATAQWGEFGEAMSKAPSIAEQSAARLASVQGAIEKLKGALETLAINIGSVFLPVLAKIAGALANLTDAFSDKLPGAMAAVQSALVPVIAALREGWDEIAPRVQAAGAAITGALQTVVAWVQTNWPAIRGELLEVWDFIAPKVAAVASTLISVLGAAFTALRPLIEPVLSFIVSHLGEIIIIAGTVATAFAVFTTIAGIVAGVAGAFAGLVATISGIVAIVVPIGAAFLAAGGGIVGLGAAAAAAGGPFAALIALMGGPVTVAMAALALAVGVLALAWANDWGGIRDKTAAVISEIQTSLQNFGAFLKESGISAAFLAAFDALKDADVGAKVKESNFGDKVKEAFLLELDELKNADVAAKVEESNFGQKAADAIRTEFEELKNANLGETLGPAVLAAFDALRDADIGAKVRDANLGQRAKDAITEDLGAMRDADWGTSIILPAIDNALAAIKDANVGGAIKDANLGGRMKDDIGAAFDELKDADWGSKIVSALESAFQQAKDANLKTDIKSIVEKEFDELKNANLGSKLVGAMQEAFDMAVNANLGGKLKKQFQEDNAGIEADARSTWERIKGVLSDIWEGIKSTASSAWAGIKGAISDGWRDIQSTTETVWNTIKQAVSDAWFNIKATIIMEVAAAATLIRGLPEKVGDVAKLLWQKGVDIVQGLIDGIKSMGGQVVTAIKSAVTDNIPGPIRKAMGIDSPSKVMFEIGEHIVDGLVLGITSGGPAVTDAAQALGDEAVAGLEQSLSGIASSAAFMSDLAASARELKMPIAEAEAEVRRLKVALAADPKNEGLKKAVTDAQAVVTSLKGQLSDIKAGIDAAFGERTALEGFTAAMDAASKSVLAVGNSLFKALVDNSYAAGEGLKNNIQRVIDEATKIGVPNAAAMGAEIITAFATALEERTPEAIQAALSLINQLGAATSARSAELAAAEAAKRAQAIADAALTGTNIANAIGNATRTAAEAQQFGSIGSKLVNDIRAAQEASTPALIASIGAGVAAMNRQYDALPAYFQGFLAPRMAELALQLASAPGSPEALEAAAAAAAGLTTVLRLVPKGFEDMIPDVKAIIVRLVGEVDAGTIGIEAASARIAEITKLIPSSFEELPPLVQTAILSIVAAVDAGEKGIKDAQKQVAFTTKALGGDFEDLPPRIQDAIKSIVSNVDTGVLSIKSAERQISAVTKLLGGNFDELLQIVQSAMQTLAQSVQSGSMTAAQALTTQSEIMKNVLKELGSEFPEVRARAMEYLQSLIEGKGATQGFADGTAQLTKHLKAQEDQLKAVAAETQKLAIAERNANNAAAGYTPPTQTGYNPNNGGPQYSGGSSGGSKSPTMDAYGNITGNAPPPLPPPPKPQAVVGASPTANSIVAQQAWYNMPNPHHSGIGEQPFSSAIYSLTRAGNVAAHWFETVGGQTIVTKAIMPVNWFISKFWQDQIDAMQKVGAAVSSYQGQLDNLIASLNVERQNAMSTASIKLRMDQATMDKAGFFSKYGPAGTSDVIAKEQALGAFFARSLTDVMEERAQTAAMQARDLAARTAMSELERQRDYGIAVAEGRTKESFLTWGTTAESRAAAERERLTHVITRVSDTSHDDSAAMRKTIEEMRAEIARLRTEGVGVRKDALDTYGNQRDLNQGRAAEFVGAR